MAKGCYFCMTRRLLFFPSSVFFFLIIPIGLVFLTLHVLLVCYIPLNCCFLATLCLDRKGDN